MQQCVGVGRTAGDVNVNRNHGVHAASGGIIDAEDAAAATARAHRHNQLPQDHELNRLTSVSSANAAVSLPEPGAGKTQQQTPHLSPFWTLVRKTIGEVDELDDADSADIFTEISRGIDKWLWFVKAHSLAQK